jgi:hypothetical protein
MSSAQRASAKDQMHNAEAVVDGILWLTKGCARLARAALNLVGATAHVLQGN